MIKCYLNLNIFTAFLKNKNIIFKIRSKVTDYAALNGEIFEKLIFLKTFEAKVIILTWYV